MNYLLMPTVARFPADIATSWQCAQSAQGYNPGLMLVILGGSSGMTGIEADVQRQNLQALQDAYEDAPVVVMLSNIPIEQMDWYHHAAVALQHVKTGIDFARSLPLGGRRIVTFHLNTLLSHQEWVSKSQEEHEDFFRQHIAGVLREAVQYAKQKNVELKIESVPIPEFGDIPITDERTYRGVGLRELRNPFPLYATSFAWEGIRQLDIGLCLDLCHNRVLHQTLGSNDWQQALLRDVSALVSSDVVHVNDGRGIFTPEGSCFEEGVALGAGDINNMSEIISVMRQKEVVMVLEVNESDYTNRPNARASLTFLNNISR